MNANIKKEIAELPKTPGVYFFIGPNNEILYIGKATTLKSRVQSYFSKDILEKRGPVIEKMVLDATNINYQETDSVLEALILEANLIKKHQPRYNTKEKSDKSFVYLIITAEDIPRLIIKREKDFLEKKVTEKIKYSFGPFRSRSSLEDILKIVRKIFPFFTRKNSYNEKSNLYKQIGLLPNLSVSVEDYKKDIKNIADFFSGKKKTIIKNLEKEMKLHAKNLEFEKAEIVKRKVFALRHTNDVTLLDSDGEKYFSETIRIEAYDVAHLAGENMGGVMTVVENGEVNKQEYRKFTINSFKGIDDNRALREVLERRFRHPEWTFPNYIVTDGGIAQKRTAEKVLREFNLSDQIKVIGARKNKQHKVEALLGQKDSIEKYKKHFILANSEAHNFSLAFHKQKRNKNFIK